MHLRPLIIFLISVGCRPAEALSLDWPDVDLKRQQAILTLGKVIQKQWTVQLRLAAMQASASLLHRHGRVFRTWITSDDDGRGVIGEGYTGGRFGTAWELRARRAACPANGPPRSMSVGKNTVALTHCIRLTAPATPLRRGTAARTRLSELKLAGPQPEWASGMGR